MNEWLVRMSISVPQHTNPHCIHILTADAYDVNAVQDTSNNYSYTYTGMNLLLDMNINIHHIHSQHIQNTGRHDHGKLPVLRNAGHNACLLTALAEAKKQCDEYLTNIINVQGKLCCAGRTFIHLYI